MKREEPRGRAKPLEARAPLEEGLGLAARGQAQATTPLCPLAAPGGNGWSLGAVWGEALTYGSVGARG